MSYRINLFIYKRIRTKIPAVILYTGTILLPTKSTSYTRAPSKRYGIDTGINNIPTKRIAILKYTIPVYTNKNAQRTASICVNNGL